jgi:hypothetical protein
LSISAIWPALARIPTACARHSNVHLTLVTFQISSSQRSASRTASNRIRAVRHKPVYPRQAERTPQSSLRNRFLHTVASPGASLRAASGVKGPCRPSGPVCHSRCRQCRRLSCRRAGLGGRSPSNSRSQMSAGFDPAFAASTICFVILGIERAPGFPTDFYRIGPQMRGSIVQVAMCSPSKKFSYFSSLLQSSAIYAAGLTFMLP